MKRHTRRRLLRAGCASLSLATLGCVGRSGRPGSGTDGRPGSGSTYDRDGSATDDSSATPPRPEQYDGVRWSSAATSFALAVADGVVYARGEDGVHAMDGATGEQRWSALDDVPAAVVTGPTVGEDVLVFARDTNSHYNGSPAVYAVEYDGTERWRAPVDGAVNHDPYLYRGRAYVATRDGTVDALDVESGERTWSRSYRNEGDAVPAAVAGVTNGSLVVAVPDGTLRGLDPVTGGEDWSYDELSAVTDVRLDDGVLFAGWRSLGRLVDGSPRWTVSADRPDIRGPVGDVVPVVRRAEVVAYDLASGDVAWRHGTPSRPTVLVGEDVLYVATDELVALRPDGSAEWSRALGDEPIEDLATGNDALYALTPSDVYRIRPDGGDATSASVPELRDLVGADRAYATWFHGGTADAGDETAALYGLEL